MNWRNVRTGAALFQQPEQSFDRHIDYVVGSFLAGGAVHDMRDAVDGFADHGAIRDVALDDV